MRLAKVTRWYLSFKCTVFFHYDPFLYSCAFLLYGEYYYHYELEVALNQADLIILYYLYLRMDLCGTEIKNSRSVTGTFNCPH